jgi:hypothetical protein
VVGFVLEIEEVVVGLARLGTRIVAVRRGLEREFELLSMVVVVRMDVEGDFAGRPKEEGNHDRNHGCSIRHMEVDLGVQHRKLLVVVRYLGKDCMVLLVTDQSLDWIYSRFAVAGVVEWVHR